MVSRPLALNRMRGSRTGRRGGASATARLLDETIVQTNENVAGGSPDFVSAAHRGTGAGKPMILTKQNPFSSSSSMEAETVPLGVSSGGAVAAVLGVGDSVFDAGRALAVLESLASAGAPLQSEADTCIARLSSKIEELRTLRTSEAERVLQTAEAAWAAKTAAQDRAVTAMREEMADLEARLRAAESRGPSDAEVRATPVFREMAARAAAAERRAAAAEQSARQVEAERDALMSAIASRRADSHHREGAARAGAAAVTAALRDSRVARARADAVAGLLARMTNIMVAPIPTHDDNDDNEDEDEVMTEPRAPTVFRCIVPVDSEEAEFELELVGEAAGDGECDVEVRPVRGSHLLPEFMRETISFRDCEAPAFLKSFLATMLGEAPA